MPNHINSPPSSIGRTRLAAALLAASLSLSVPAYAQLSQPEATIKQALEQKARDGGLSSQELALYKSLVEKDRESAFSQSAQKPAGEVFGWVGAMIVAGTAALGLCSLGVIAACPVVLALFGGG